jgi:hypothetical protein
MNLNRYQNARCKVDKTLVVIGIVNSIRRSSPCGGFIKKCPKTGRWISMSDEAAREKVGHCLRDMIASTRIDNQYGKSNNSNRNKQQQMQQPNFNGSFLVRSEAFAPAFTKNGPRKAKAAKFRATENMKKTTKKKLKEMPLVEYGNSGIPTTLPAVAFSNQRPHGPAAVHHTPHMRYPGPRPDPDGGTPASSQQFPNGFNNYDQSVRGTNQEMSEQQHRILHLLENGFRGSVEELLEAVQ